MKLCHCLYNTVWPYFQQYYTSCLYTIVRSLKLVIRGYTVRLYMLNFNMHTGPVDIILQFKIRLLYLPEHTEIPKQTRKYQNEQLNI